jgi:hypothetical protein
MQGRSISDCAEWYCRVITFVTVDPYQEQKNTVGNEAENGVLETKE